MTLRLRWLARQFARPSGVAGRLFLGPWLNSISRSMNRLVLEQLDIQGDDDVLEVGFGGGGLLSEMALATKGRIVGADISAEMVVRARRRLRGRAELYVASVESLPIADASVDKACSVNTIYFWPDPGAGMIELARVLRPGGRLAIAFEPPEELRKWPGHPHGFRLLEETEVRAMMEMAGLTGIRHAEGRGSRPDFFLCLTGERVGGQAAP